MSDSLWPHGLQHARLPCPSPSPGACSNSCPLSQWCHPLILCCPLLLLPSIFPRVRVFFNELALHNRWPNYWSFSFSISPSNEYSGLISFRIDRFDLLAVQGTLKTLLQHYSSKASIIWHSVFFMVQLLHPYMTTGKTIALTTDFCGKVMLLLLLLLLSCFSHLWFCATPETAAHQAPPSLGFSRQEHWSGLPFPSLMHASEKWKWSRSVVSNS